MTEEEYINRLSSEIAKKIDEECIKEIYGERHKQQDLVDICYDLVLTCTEERNIKIFKKMTNEEKAEWVRRQLTNCGFPNHPQGALWGVLDK